MFDVTLKKCCQALRGKHEKKKKKSFVVVWCTHDMSWQHSRALSAVEDQIVKAARRHFEEMRTMQQLLAASWDLGLPALVWM